MLGQFCFEFLQPSMGRQEYLYKFYKKLFRWHCSRFNFGFIHKIVVGLHIEFLPLGGPVAGIAVLFLFLVLLFIPFLQMVVIKLFVVSLHLVVNVFFGRLYVTVFFDIERAC